MNTQREYIPMVLAVLVGAVVIALFFQAFWDTLRFKEVMETEQELVSRYDGGGSSVHVERGVDGDIPYLISTRQFPTDYAVVYLPGILATCEECVPTVRTIAERGYDVYMIHRPADLDIAAIAAAVLRVWKKISRRNYTTRVLVGHSFGSLIALHLAVTAREEFCGVVLVHPYLGLQPRFLSLLFDALILRAGKSKVLPSYDRGMEQYVAATEYQRVLLQNHGLVRIPVSVVLAEHEHLVSNDVAAEFAKNLRARMYRTWSSHYFGPASASFHVVLSAIGHASAGGAIGHART